MQSDLEPLIQEFQKMYEATVDRNYFVYILSSVIQNDLHNLAKQIIERLTPDELASRNDSFHTFGPQLARIFKDLQDRDGLIRLAKLYENLGEYDFAKENYLSSSDYDSILGFISRSIQNPKSINYGISTLKKLKEYPQLKCPPFLIEMAFYKAFGFKKYDLAMDIAYLTNDKWKQEEVQSATGLKSISTIL